MKETLKLPLAGFSRFNPLGERKPRKGFIYRVGSSTREALGSIEATQGTVRAQVGHRPFHFVSL